MNFYQPLIALCIGLILIGLYMGSWTLGLCGAWALGSLVALALVSINKNAPTPVQDSDNE